MDIEYKSGYVQSKMEVGVSVNYTSIKLSGDLVPNIKYEHEIDKRKRIE